MVRNLVANAEDTRDASLIPVLKIPWRRAKPGEFLPGEIPWTEEPGGLQSIGWQRVRHD